MKRLKQSLAILLVSVLLLSLLPQNFLASDNEEIIYITNIDDYEIDENGTLIKYYGTDANIALPEGITKIADHAFYQWRHIQNVKISSGVLSIEEHAFDGCSNLESVIIPEGVVYIGKNAFANCRWLSDITLPSTLENVGAQPFYKTAWQTERRMENPLVIVGDILVDGVTATGDVVIPEGIRVIADNAFYWYDISADGKGYCSITSVTIPEGVKSIGAESFKYCWDLKTIEFPEGLESIGKDAFYNCYTLESIVLKPGLKHLGANAFNSCIGIESVVLPEGVTHVGHSLFQETIWYNELEKSDNPLKIAYGILFAYYSDENCVIPEGVRVIAESAFATSQAKKIQLPSTLTHINDNAFNSFLTEIELPKGLVEIGAKVFKYTQIKELVLPESLTTIGDNAFEDSALTYLKIPKNVSSIGKDAFKKTEFKVIVERNSYAHQYAAQNNYLYVCTDNLATGITLSKTKAEVQFEDSIQLNAYVETLAENNKDVVWKSSDTRIATIDENGRIEALNAGTVTITATTTDGTKLSASCELTVTPIAFSPELFDVAINDDFYDDYVYDGDEFCPLVVVYRKDGVLMESLYDYDEEYKNNVNAGTAEVILTGKGNYTGSLHIYFTIEKDTVKNGKIIIWQNNFTYNGKAHTPEIFVEGEVKGPGDFVENRDYKVTYKNNVNAGNATIKVEFMGNYESTVLEETFVINKASIKNAKVSLSTSKYYYDGKTKTPSVKVQVGGRTLKKNTDYTLKYSKNKEIGTATVTITGKGNYTGTIKKTFTISAKKGKTFTYGAYKYKVTGTSTVAFTGLKSIKTTKVTIPATVRYGGKTFKVTEIADKALQNKTKVTSVVIGSNIKTIGDYAFYGCKKLSKVTLGKAVVTIEDQAFAKCTSLKSITIPSKVSKIDKKAFYSCKCLKTIVFKTTKLKTIGKECFKGIYSKATIKVPKSKLDNYKKLLKGKGQSSKVKIKY